MGGRHYLRRRLPPERGRAVEIQLRGERPRLAAVAVQRLRSAGEALDGGRPRPPGLRDGAEMLAHLQPAGRAGSDLGHRTRGIHRTRASARETRRAGLLRIPREAGLSDAEAATRDKEESPGLNSD